MPNYYSGDPSLYLVQLAKVVDDATNASPIVLRTTTAHGFNTGDKVIVQAVSGNTAANSPPNSPWTITVTDATHFELDGSAGNGSFSGNGRAFDLDMIPLTLPSDGDPDEAASWNVASEGLADRTQALALARPYQRVQNVYNAGTTDDTWATWANRTLAGPSAWDIVKNGGVDVGDLFDFSANPPEPRCNYGDAFHTNWQIGNVAVTIDYAVTLAYQISSVAANAVQQVEGGALFLPSGFNGPVSGSSLINLNSVAQGLTAAVSAVSGDTYTITGLSGMSTASVGDTLNLLGADSDGNNGAFLITDYVSATSVKVYNPDGVVGDANNGAIIWYVTDMKFSFQLQIQAVGTSVSSSYTMTGHRAMSTIHYRPAQITIPGL